MNMTISSYPMGAAAQRGQSYPMAGPMAEKAADHGFAMPPAQAPLNFMAYRPKNVNIVNLPAGMGRIIMDPRRTSVSKIKNTLNLLNRYERMMMQKYERKIAEQLSDPISDKSNFSRQNDPIEKMVDKCTKRIMNIQDQVLHSSMGKQIGAGF